MTSDIISVLDFLRLFLDKYDEKNKIELAI